MEKYFPEPTRRSFYAEPKCDWCAEPEIFRGTDDCSAHDDERKKFDYSTIDEIVKIDVLSDFSDEEIITAVNELTKRGFLFEIEKPYGCVYGVNKLRIANMEFIY